MFLLALSRREHNKYRCIASFNLVLSGPISHSDIMHDEATIRRRAGLGRLQYECNTSDNTGKYTDSFPLEKHCAISCLGISWGLGRAGSCGLRSRRRGLGGIFTRSASGCSSTGGGFGTGSGRTSSTGGRLGKIGDSCTTANAIREFKGRFSD